jgi:hypothetical protein
MTMRRELGVEPTSHQTIDMMSGFRMEHDVDSSHRTSNVAAQPRPRVAKQRSGCSLLGRALDEKVNKRSPDQQKQREYVHDDYPGQLSVDGTDEPRQKEKRDHTGEADQKGYWLKRLKESRSKQ